MRTSRTPQDRPQASASCAESGERKAGVRDAFVKTDMRKPYNRTRVPTAPAGAAVRRARLLSHGPRGPCGGPQTCGVRSKASSPLFPKPRNRQLAKKDTQCRLSPCGPSHVSWLSRPPPHPTAPHPIPAGALGTPPTAASARTDRGPHAAGSVPPTVSYRTASSSKEELAYSELVPWCVHRELPSDSHTKEPLEHSHMLRVCCVYV